MSDSQDTDPVSTSHQNLGNLRWRCVSLDSSTLAFTCRFGLSACYRFMTTELGYDAHEVSPSCSYCVG